MAGVAPVVAGTGLLVAHNHSVGVGLTGIDPARESAASTLDRNALLGRGVATRLNAGVGDSVTAVLPDASVTLIGLLPRQKRLHVVGIVDTQSELDQRSVYMNLVDAQRLFRLGDRVDGLNLRLTDLFHAADVGAAAVELLGTDDVYATTWMRMHGNLYRAIQFQRAMMFLLLSLLVGVAAFNLVSALIMVVNQRRGDVAVLRTLGASTTTIVMTFMVLGCVIGIIGVGLGLALGSGGAVLAADAYRALERTFGLNLMSQYFISYLPAEVRLKDIVSVAVIALLLSLASTIYPAFRAARLNPAEVLKHE